MSGRDGVRSSLSFVFARGWDWPGGCWWSLPGGPMLGFVPFMSLELPKVHLSGWSQVQPSVSISPHQLIPHKVLSADLHNSCLWILPVFLDPLLQFASGISCVLSVLDLFFFFLPSVLFARVISFANINLVIVLNQVMPALSSAPILMCVSSPLFACWANSSNSVRLNQAF